jgi:hypothetical protein
MFEYKVTRELEIENGHRQWLEICSMPHNKPGLGIRCMYSNKWIALTIYDGKHTFIKQTEDTDTYFKSSKEFHIFRHVYSQEYKTWGVLKGLVPVGTLVSVFDDCVKVSCIIPKELYIFQENQWTMMSFNKVYSRKSTTSHVPNAEYMYNTKTYSNHWISEKQYTPGLYGCTNIRQLKDWGCLSIPYEQICLFK